MSRQPISKRVRYEVLRRDNFACRYCGVPSPVVVLHIDHVIPVAEGGTNDAWNLTAACPDCNAGKRASMPDDRVVLAVRQDEAAYAGLAPCEYCSRPSPDDMCDECTGVSQQGYYIGLDVAARKAREAPVVPRDDWWAL